MSDTDSDGRGMLRLDPHARYLPSRTYFPRGLSYIAGKVHELGLKFGLHIMRGIARCAVRDNLPIEGAGLRARDIAVTTSTCSWSDQCYGVDVSQPAGRAYYDCVFDLLASWGVDFIKADDLVPYPDEIEAILASIYRAEKKHGRTIRLSLSPGNVVLWDHMPTYHPAAALRITPDLWDRRADLERSFDALASFTTATHGAPRSVWPDLDMIPFGHLQLGLPADAIPPGRPEPFEGTERWRQFTPDQKRSYLTLRALACSPLLLGGALVDLPDDDIVLLTQPDLLACHDHPRVATPILRTGQLEVWRKSSGHTTRLGVFNRHEVARTVCLPATNLEVPLGSPMSQVWTDRPARWQGDDLPLNLGPDGVGFLKIVRKKTVDR